MSTYSFQDVKGTLSGPGGSVRIGDGSGSAEEGITVSMAEDKGSMTTGADGEVMHSLHAGKSGTITIRLLKTSPTNAKLQQLYDLQTSSSALYAANTITVSDIARGDFITGREAAFAKLPDIAYSKEGAMNDWVFNVGKIDMKLGAGLNLGGLAAAIIG